MEEEIIKDLETLWRSGDAHANSRLMIFQESQPAWDIAIDLFSRPNVSSQVQHVALQILDWKIRFNFESQLSGLDKLPTQRRLVNFYLDNLSRVVAKSSVNKFASGLGQLVVLLISSWWSSAIEDLIGLAEGSAARENVVRTIGSIIVELEKLDIHPSRGRYLSNIHVPWRESQPCQIIVANIPRQLDFIIDCCMHTDESPPTLTETILETTVTIFRILEFPLFQKQKFAEAIMGILSKASFEPSMEFTSEALPRCRLLQSSDPIAIGESKLFDFAINGLSKIPMILSSDLVLDHQPALLCCSSIASTIVVSSAAPSLLACPSPMRQSIFNSLATLATATPALTISSLSFWADLRESFREIDPDSRPLGLLRALLEEVSPYHIQGALTFSRTEGAEDATTLFAVREAASDALCAMHTLAEYIRVTQGSELLTCLTSKVRTAIETSDPGGVEAVVGISDGLIELLTSQDEEVPIPSQNSGVAALLGEFERVIWSTESGARTACGLLSRVSMSLADSPHWRSGLRICWNLVPMAPEEASRIFAELCRWGQHNVPNRSEIVQQVYELLISLEESQTIQVDANFYSAFAHLLVAAANVAALSSALHKSAIALKSDYVDVRHLVRIAATFEVLGTADESVYLSRGWASTNWDQIVAVAGRSLNSFTGDVPIHLPPALDKSASVINLPQSLVTTRSSASQALAALLAVRAVISASRAPPHIWPGLIQIAIRIFSSNLRSLVDHAMFSILASALTYDEDPPIDTLFASLPIVDLSSHIETKTSNLDPTDFIWAQPFLDFLNVWGERTRSRPDVSPFGNRLVASRLLQSTLTILSKFPSSPKVAKSALLFLLLVGRAKHTEASAVFIQMRIQIMECLLISFVDWDTRVFAPAVRLMDGALIADIDDRRDELRMAIHRIWSAPPLGLYLAPPHLAIVADAMVRLRSVRLRQLLLDLRAICQGLQTRDCLVAYEFVQMSQPPSPQFVDIS